MNLPLNGEIKGHVMRTPLLENVLLVKILGAAGAAIIIFVDLILSKNPARIFIISTLFVSFCFIFDMLFNKIHKTFTVPLMLYGIVMHIKDPSFFIVPLFSAVLLYFLFVPTNFGGGDYKSLLALSLIVPNQVFIAIYVATFATAAVVSPLFRKHLPAALSRKLHIPRSTLRYRKKKSTATLKENH